MNVLITGAAGFIGSELALKLLERGDAVFGIDDHNDYYDVSLKEARLARHINNKRYNHARFDISNKSQINDLINSYRVEIYLP